MMFGFHYINKEREKGEAGFMTFWYTTKQKKRKKANFYFRFFYSV